MPLLLPQISLVNVSPEVTRQCSHALIYEYHSFMHMYVCVHMCIEVYMQMERRCVCTDNQMHDSLVCSEAGRSHILRDMSAGSREKLQRLPGDDFFLKGWPP